METLRGFEESFVYLRQIRLNLNELYQHARARHVDVSLLNSTIHGKSLSELLRMDADEIPVEITIAEWKMFVGKVRSEVNNTAIQRVRR
jgi:hypothetical protein